MLVKAVGGSAGLRIAGMAFGFLVGVQLARGLGAEGYGVYGLAMSVIALLTVPTQFGLPQLLTREVAVVHVAGNWGRLHGILKWSMRASMVIATVVAAGVLLWLAWHREFESAFGATLLAGLVLVPVVAVLSLRSSALRGVQQIVKGQAPEVLLRPALHSCLLFFVGLFVVPLTPALAMWLGVLGAVVSLFVADRLLHRALPRAVFSAPVETDARGWWRSAVPMAMTEGMRILQAHLLIFFLGGMVALADVGVFRMAASTALLVSMPLGLFNIVSMPIIARLHAADQRAQLQRMMTMVSLGMTAGVFLLSAPFFLAGEWLLTRVFGQDFATGSWALSLLCLSATVNALFGVSAALLNMTGHQKTVTTASLVGLVVLVVTAPLLIRSHGIEGAAAANLLSVLAWNLLLWHGCRRLLGVETGVIGLLSLTKDRTK